MDAQLAGAGALSGPYPATERVENGLLGSAKPGIEVSSSMSLAPTQRGLIPRLAWLLKDRLPEEPCLECKDYYRDGKSALAHLCEKRTEGHYRE